MSPTAEITTLYTVAERLNMSGFEVDIGSSSNS